MTGSSGVSDRRPHASAAFAAYQAGKAGEAEAIGRAILALAVAVPALTVPVPLARVAIGAVAPTALLVPAAADALIGTKVDDAALAAAGAACTAAASPISDKRGTIEYRNKVVAVLCRRAGANARDRALAR